MISRFALAAAAAAVLAVLGLASCGGGRTQIEIGPPPAKMTIGTLAGPLCDGAACRCRTPNDDAGVPEGARKRYEVKLGPSPHDLWVKLDDRVLYKSPERAEACFYVDLAPGQHQVELRASNPHGVSAALAIHELGTETRSWYDTFRFSCGSPGACAFRELDDERARFAAVEKNLHDKCGSTKIKGIVWDHGKAPDQEHPSELVVRLVLDIYKFAPDQPSGSEACGAGGRGRKAGEGDAEGGD